MELTKERKIYAGVLVLALGALGWTLMPSSAAASSTAAATGPGAADLLVTAGDSNATDAALTDQAVRGPAVVSVAERLRAYAKTANLDESAAQADAFCPPSAWAASLVPQKHIAQARLVESPLAVFPQRHRLDAVLLSKPDSSAIIDGRVITVGQTLDGFRLVGVTQKTAVMQSSAGQVVLKIPEATIADVR